MEEFTSAEASSEAGVLATGKYEELKSKECQGPTVKIEMFCGEVEELKMSTSPFHPNTFICRILYLKCTIFLSSIF